MRDCLKVLPIQDTTWESVSGRLYSSEIHEKIYTRAYVPYPRCDMSESAFRHILPLRDAVLGVCTHSKTWYERICLRAFKFAPNPRCGMREFTLERTQWAHNVKMTSYQRRCDVITSHRRWYDVILMLFACWVCTAPEERRQRLCLKADEPLPL